MIERMIMLISTILACNFSIGAIDKIDTLIVTDSSIIIDQNTVLSFPISVDTLERILGNSRKHKTKSESAHNDIYFWDKLGLMVFCRKNERNITSLDVCFRRSSWEETRRMFKGVIILGNNSINKNMKRSDLEEIGFGGASHPTAIFDEHRTIDLLKLHINAEFKEDGGKFIGIGIFSRKE